MNILFNKNIFELMRAIPSYITIAIQQIEKIRKAMK